MLEAYTVVQYGSYVTEKQLKLVHAVINVQETVSKSHNSSVSTTHETERPNVIDLNAFIHLLIELKY